MAQCKYDFFRLRKTQNLDFQDKEYVCDTCQDKCATIPPECGHAVLIGNKDLYLARGTKDRALKTCPEEFAIRDSVTAKGLGLFSTCRIARGTFMGEFKHFCFIYA